MERIEKAQRWAARGHKGVERRYTGLPYIVHPEAVAEIVSQLTDDPDVIAAAWLHDVVEDVEDVSFGDIHREFNHKIAEYVYEVTKISRPKDGNRAARVRLDEDHYARASKWGKVIKLADCIHNLPTMIRDNPDPAFYVREKKSLLRVIRDGSPLLASIVDHIIDDYEKGLTVMDVYSSMKEIKR